MFSIDADYNIQVCEQASDDSSAFDSLKELTAIAEMLKWSKADVTAIWNRFAGVAGPFGNLRAQKCFKNRPYGLAAIWKAIQRLMEPGATPFDEAPQKRDSKPKKAKVIRPKAPGTKRDEVLRLIGRRNGAALAEIMEKTGWQPHSVRGFISTLGSKHGIKIASTKSDNGLIYKTEVA